MKNEELLKIINPEIKELFEFLSGFGLTFYYEKDEPDEFCDVESYYLEGKSKDIDIRVMNVYDERYRVYIDPKGWFNKASQCYFKLPLPKSKKDYKSLLSYLLEITDMRRKQVSFGHCVTEYGMTFDDYQEKYDKKKKSLKKLK